MKSINIKPLILSMLVISLASCVTERKEGQIESVNTEVIEKEVDSEKVERIKTIFHSLPSPFELSGLFKKEGIKYYSEKLHRIDKRNEYVETIKKALNLGVYGADLSYAGLFGEHQDAILFFTSSQLLAEDLGIGKTFQQEFVTRLQNNASNKDSLLAIVTDFFKTNDAYLKDHDQQDISTYVLAGGWVEGMYLGTQMADSIDNKPGIIQIIVDQQKSLHNLIILLQNVRESTESEILINSIGKLELLFSGLKSEENTSTEFIAVNDSSLIQIREQVASIRERIVEK